MPASRLLHSRLAGSCLNPFHLTLAQSSRERRPHTAVRRDLALTLRVHLADCWASARRPAGLSLASQRSCSERWRRPLCSQDWWSAPWSRCEPLLPSLSGILVIRILTDLFPEGVETVSKVLSAGVWWVVALLWVCVLLWGLSARETWGPRRYGERTC